jgi:hypothetical protein
MANCSDPGGCDGFFGERFARRVAKRYRARRGAAVSSELSPAYESEARALLDEPGLARRGERRMVDIAVAPESVEPVDGVVRHRVGCCYPDYERLPGAAAERAAACSSSAMRAGTS